MDSGKRLRECPLLTAVATPEPWPVSLERPFGRALVLNNQVRTESSGHQEEAPATRQAEVMQRRDRRPRASPPPSTPSKPPL
jgi:hypothetical protein